MNRNEEPTGVGINGVIPGAGACVVCRAPCPKNALMCRRHWSQVPTGLRFNLRDAMSRWNRNQVTLDVLRGVQWACVDAVSPEKD